MYTFSCYIVSITLLLLLLLSQEYVELYSTARDFIGHVNEIAGRVPLESSHGDDKLLPKFVVSLVIIITIISHVIITVKPMIKDPLRGGHNRNNFSTKRTHLNVPIVVYS